MGLISIGFAGDLLEGPTAAERKASQYPKIKARYSLPYSWVGLISNALSKHRAKVSLLLGGSSENFLSSSKISARIRRALFSWFCVYVLISCKVVKSWQDCLLTYKTVERSFCEGLFSALPIRRMRSEILRAYLIFFCPISTRR